MSESKVSVAPVTGKGDLNEFVDLTYRLNENDPNWVPPLRSEAVELLTPGKNPFHDHARVQYLLARRGGRVVGRISAHIDELALALEIDGDRVRDTSAQAMPVPVRESLAYVARWVRLGPGDVVMAGAPHSNHDAAPGQTAAVIVGDTRLETPLR